MISQTETASNQYGFYAVPKKLEPKKKYRDEEYEDMMNDNDDEQQSNEFHPILRPTHPEHELEPDYYINQAPYPEFKPKESGLDYGVQVISEELMDFDLEVTPLLEILVGRCVVSAINELQEEKEKVEKKQEAEQYRKQRNAELMVTQRLEAKSKRKHEETQRRQLQQSIYHKNNRHIHEKIINRKLAKNKLLNLGEDVIAELEQDGMLRYEPTLELRIDYEGWLYNEVTRLISQESQVTTCIKKLINEVEEDDEEKHKKKIEKEKERRRNIINEREKVNQEKQLRREKKRVHKYRVNLHNLREPLVRRFEQLLEGSVDVKNSGVLKYDILTDGFVGNGNGNGQEQQQQPLHVSGGLFQYLLVLLNSTPQVHHTPDELEELLFKLLNELKKPLEIQIQHGQLQIIKQLLQEMENNTNTFMIDKVSKVAEISKRVSFNLRLVELAGLEIKPLLVEAMVLALMNVYFTSTKIEVGGNGLGNEVVSGNNGNMGSEEEQKQQQNEQQEEEGQSEKQSEHQQQQEPSAIYSPTEQDKLRETIREKILFKEIDNEEERLSKLETVLRVRFERESHKEEEEGSEINKSESSNNNNKDSGQEQQQNEQEQQQEQWIDIFDGQGWQRHTQKHPTELERQTQKPSTYQLNGFDNVFVYDERVLYFVRKEIERVLEIESGKDEVEKYNSGLADLAKKLNKDVPVIDGELLGGSE